MQYPAQDILNEAKALEDTLRELRRDFHRHPELGFEEVWTTAKIKEVLAAIPDIVIKEIPCKTGVIAELPGREPASGTIGLRCDIDALSIEELNTHGYESLTKGLMHACGHDGHIAINLGAAMLLSKFRPRKNVRFLFQPAEETTPDGAPDFIAAKALEGLESVWGFHINATSDFGNIGYYDGTVMAGGTGFIINVTGKSGHQVYPESCINPVDVLCKIAIGLEAIKSTIRGTRSYLVVPCSINSGSLMNPAIPGTGSMSGRIAFHEKAIDLHVRERITAIAESVGALYGAKVEVEFEDHLPLTYNHPELGSIVRDNAKEFGFALEQIFPSMGSDDFGYYADLIPAYYMTFGIRKGENFPIAHTQIFDFDEAILPIAAAQFASCALV